MSHTSTIPAPTSAAFDRDALPQYSRRQVLAVWAAVTAPMFVLSWLVSPWLGHRIGGQHGFVTALVLCFNAGLLWEIALVAVLVHRERGSLRWPEVRDALWLRAPQDPRTGRVGGRVWWWIALFVVLTAAVNALPIDPVGPLNRDLPKALEMHSLDGYFAGNWMAFALITVNALLAPVAEDLVFRGLLLPRMRAVCGRWDVVANATIFTAYHLHQPWSMPATFLDSLINQAWATKRFRSTWFGLITHTAPSFLIIGVILALVV